MTKRETNDRMLPLGYSSPPISLAFFDNFFPLFFCSSFPHLNLTTKYRYASIFQREKGGYQATTEEGGLYDIVYYFGIIDIFTTYNIKKQLEHTYKSTLYETKVFPYLYSCIFRRFISLIFSLFYFLFFIIFVG
jgi:hypothetical protein